MRSRNGHQEGNMEARLPLEPFPPLGGFFFFLNKSSLTLLFFCVDISLFSLSMTQETWKLLAMGGFGNCQMSSALPSWVKKGQVTTNTQTHYYLLLKPNVWWSGPRSSCAFCHITRLSLHENQETYRKLMTKENIYYLFSEVESESQRHCLGTGEDSVPPWTRHTPASSLGRTLQLFPNQQLCSVLY